MSKQGKHGWWHHLVAVGVVIAKGVAHGIVWLAVGVVGYGAWIVVPSPFNLIIGLPLWLVAVGMLVNLVWDDVLVVFSDEFNHGVCPVCKTYR